MRYSGITKRTDGRWCVAYQVNGKRKYLYGVSLSETKGKLDALRKQTDKLGQIPSPGRRTVADLLELWIEKK